MSKGVERQIYQTSTSSGPITPWTAKRAGVSVIRHTTARPRRWYSFGIFALCGRAARAVSDNCETGPRNPPDVAFTRFIRVSGPLKFSLHAGPGGGSVVCFWHLPLESHRRDEWRMRRAWFAPQTLILARRQKGDETELPPGDLIDVVTVFKSAQAMLFMS